MNYRDFFKSKKVAKKEIESLLPEGVDRKEFAKGIVIESASTNDRKMAARIAALNLKNDPNYYSKIYEQYEEQEEHCGACEDDFAQDNGFGAELDVDDGSGYAKSGGALAVPHLGDPIKLGKIIQVGNEFGHGSASGEQSGMTSCGKGGNDKGGVPVQPINDKETITAGGKKVDSSIASKSVGGPVTNGGGQQQGGPHVQGSIASSHKLSEQKETVRKIVKEVLKEIRFNKSSGKWERIDEATVNMKMGPAHKVVQPTLAKTANLDWPRSNEYDPHISEMYDDEEEDRVNERYSTLATAPRNLTETELSEMKSLREKIEKIKVAKRNFGLSPGGTEPSLYEDRDATVKMGPSYRVVAPRQARVVDDDQAHRDQDTADMRNESAEEDECCDEVNEAGGGAVQHSSFRTVNDAPQIPKNRQANDIEEGKKVSKVVKAIKKGQKTKKNIPTALKHELPRHTTSGVHKRKT